MASVQLLVGASVAIAIVYLAFVAGTAIVAALRAGGRREESPVSHEALAASRLTVPVSIIVPAGHDLSPRVTATIESLLRLTYSEFEVIVVVDSPAASIETFAQTWDLEPREFFYRQTLETAGVRRILRSHREARLMVVEKAPGRRFDALNCGVNLARYRFVAVVPPDVSFDEAALLRAMLPALSDPGSVVGVSTPIERVPEGDPHTSHARFQRLQSLRSLMAGRLFWADRPHAIGPDDAVFVWRRDAVLQASGFSRLAANPDVDMMFRLQCADGRDERRVVRNASPFGHAAVLSAAASRLRTAARQRSAVQMAITWGASASSAFGSAFLLYLRSEAFTPCAQAWVVTASLVGALAGWWSWAVPVLMVLLLAFGTAAVSAAAVLVRGSHPGAPEGAELRALLLLAPLEVPLRGPSRARARLAGLVRVPPSGDGAGS